MADSDLRRLLTSDFIRHNPKSHRQSETFATSNEPELLFGQSVIWFKKFELIAARISVWGIVG